MGTRENRKALQAALGYLAERKNMDYQTVLPTFLIRPSVKTVRRTAEIYLGFSTVFWWKLKLLPMQTG